MRRLDCVLEPTKQKVFDYLPKLKTINTFFEAGFVTINEVREKDINIEHYSKKIVQWINQLLKAGIPPHLITVVGASKGGTIAANVSHRLKNKKIKYVFLASLFYLEALSRKIR